MYGLMVTSNYAVMNMDELFEGRMVMKGRGPKHQVRIPLLALFLYKHSD
jgi:hypothetical protein